MSPVPKQMRQPTPQFTPPPSAPEKPPEPPIAATTPVEPPPAPPEPQLPPPVAVKKIPPLPPDAMLTFTSAGALLFRLTWRGDWRESEIIAICHAVRDKGLTTGEAIYEQAGKLGIGGDTLRLFSVSGRIGEPEPVISDPKQADPPRKFFSDERASVWRTKTGQTLHMDITQEVAAEKRRTAARGVGRKW